MTSLARASAIMCLLFACSQDATEAHSDPTQSDTATSTSTQPSQSSTDPVPVHLTSADCNQSSDNALRLTCVLVLDGEDTGCVDAQVGSEVPRTWCSTLEGREHTVTIALLPEEREVTWSAYTETSPEQTISGVLTTGALPEVLALDVVTLSGSPNEDVWLTGYMGCNQQVVVLLDGQRRIVWYEDIPGLNAHRWTDAHELLSLSGNDTVERRGLDGVVTWSYVEPNRNVALHHDVLAWQDWVFVLHARLDDVLGSVITDGVTVIDASASRHDRWELADWVAPTASPPPFIAAYWWGDFPLGSIDWYHTNGMVMTSQQELVVSARHQSTVVAMNGDPEHRQAGEVLWHIVGSERSEVPVGMSLLADEGITPTFAGQHYPSVLPDPDDGLLIFDNLGGDTSRGLQLDLERSTQTATIRAQWPLPAICETQGSLSYMTDTSVLLACAGSWFEADMEGGVTASQTPQCRDTAQNTMMRGRVVPWTPPST